MINSETDHFEYGKRPSVITNDAKANLYRALFENAPVGIALATLDGFLHQVNPSFCRMVGYAVDELKELHIDKLLHPDDAVNDSGLLDELLQGEIAVVQKEMRFIHKLGDIFHAILLISMIKDSAPESAHLIFHLTDITEYKRTNEATYYQQKMESLGMMAGGIAHEFNNLLVAMLGQTSIAITKLGSEHAASRHLVKAVKAAQRAADLTQQMLAYSGHRHLEKQKLHLNEFVQENLPLIQAAVPKKVQVHLRLHDNLSVIMADKGQLQQALMNLILNGVEAIGERSGRLTLGTAVVRLKAEEIYRLSGLVRDLPPGHYVQISVHDNGEGMSDKVRKRIFDPFFTTKFMGRGLGLAVVMGVVVGHGGGIRVYSEQQVGTTIQLLFPAYTE